MSFTVNLAKVRGMCAGVDRAIKIVERTLELYKDRKVYVYHEVVHNRHVVDDLRNLGAVFVESLDEVPDRSVLIFSAHGVGIENFKRAEAKDLHIIDATCPVVKGIHHKMNRASKLGLDAVVIGHKGHQEVIGTIGQYTGPLNKVHVILTKEDVDELNIDGKNAFFATQTTLSVDETKLTVEALKKKYPLIQGPVDDDTCKATQVRQNAVRELAMCSDIVLIAGSANSSNSNRLKEVALSVGTRAFLIDDYTQLKDEWFENVSSVGLSAGASAPEYVVDDLVNYLLSHGADSVIPIGSDFKEKSFPLPKELL